MQATSLDADDRTAPPRRNGELVFREPWEGRAFGLVVTLCDNGLFSWDAFRARLIAAIAEADGQSAGVKRAEYYESWLAALERVLVNDRILTVDDIETRAQEFATGERDIVDPGAPGRGDTR